MTPSTSKHPEKTTPLNPSSSSDRFDLLKARLMARFSSVAYEDPPNDSSRTASLPGVETRVDDFGVSVVRPIPPNGPKRKERDESTWEMAHVDAIEPRPLGLMLSECNPAGIPDRVREEMEESRFEWVALAVNERTSAQFDVWRIKIESKDEGDGQSESAAALVVAFRGTRLSSYLDLLTDIQLRQDMIDCADFGVCTHMDGNHRGVDGIGGRETAASVRPGEPLMAHSGFLKAYSSIRSTLLQCLSDRSGTCDRLWFTGHSLGAALATLAVADVGTLLAEDSHRPIALSSESESESESPIPSAPMPREIRLPKATISAYVFGSPRVGNGAFVERLARLQTSPNPNPTVREYYRVNTPGDAVAFLPRGKVANRLGIDYVHAGASVFLPGVPSDDHGSINDADDDEAFDNQAVESSGSRNAGKWMDYSKRMMQLLEEDAVDDIIRIYRRGDIPPDPLTEIDPGYSGFFPLDPRTWSSSSFRDFLFGEAVRSFRVLRGGFAKNHRLTTYEEGLCASSQDNVFVIDNGG